METEPPYWFVQSAPDSPVLRWTHEKQAACLKGQGAGVYSTDWSDPTDKCIFSALRTRARPWGPGSLYIRNYQLHGRVTHILGKK